MKDVPTLRAAIRATSAFKDITDDDVAFLIENGTVQTFAPGAAVMLQGEPSDSAVLIIRGEVLVTADSRRGAIPVSTLYPPCLAGELGALAHIPRSATLRATTEVEAL